MSAPTPEVIDDALAAAAFNVGASLRVAGRAEILPERLVVVDPSKRTSVIADLIRRADAALGEDEGYQRDVRAWTREGRDRPGGALPPAGVTSRCVASARGTDGRTTVGAGDVRTARR